MISDGQVMGFVPTTDASRARGFYVDVLELQFLSDDPFALVVQSGGTVIRIVKVETLKPADYTILGWQVNDIEKEVRALNARGVAFMRYPPLEQSQPGIWTAPGGAMIAWFQDPDGNVLSLSQHPDA